MNFSYCKQETNYTCGPAAIRMVLDSLGIKKTETEISKLVKAMPIQGTKFKEFENLFEGLELNYMSGSGTIFQLRRILEEDYRVIVCYLDLKDKEHGIIMDHYSVIKKIDEKYIHFFDPWYGKNHGYSISHFRKIWKSRDRPDKIDRWFIAVKN